MNTFFRLDGRGAREVRPRTLKYDVFGYADASVLFSLGNTKVFISVSLRPEVPVFLRGSGTGWLTAEYAMLPTATKVRTLRELSSHKRQGRNVEISRLIGRCYRTVVDVAHLGERTIMIDCDVLQADGGTRTACITAAGYALKRGMEVWKRKGYITESLLSQPLGAISGGFIGETLLLDLTQEEDSRAESDMNFVMTQAGDIVEIQGTAEQTPLAWHQFVSLKEAAVAVIPTLLSL